MALTKTASMSTTDTEVGTHVFSIIRYSKHKGIGLGMFVRSGVFSVGGHDWAIRFYPGGVPKIDYVAVVLEILSRGVTLRVSADLRLVNQITGLPSLVMRTPPVVFHSDPSRRFVPLTVWHRERSEFEGSVFLRDDRIDIECVVTVMKEPRVSHTKCSPRIEVPPTDIAAHLGKLLETKEEADVTFYAGGETFAAHKIVLAMRSPVFKAELFGPMRENRAQAILIEEMQPDVFKALLHFIYTDSVPIVDDLEGDDRSEMVRHLLVAADRYAMERLKLMCQGILCEDLDVENVATTLALADMHHCGMLKDACIEFMSSATMEDIGATQGYMDLKKNYPSLLVDAFMNMTKLHKK